ncbi:MAG: hypothetical protein FD179_970 [Erysipelotrichaceae bacterium]|nr:MAG: hypothetical protein FD179_970 [Erysipelotrichaceae bacterium]
MIKEVLKKFLITGCSGFIRNSIVDLLSKTKEYDIVVLDCFSKQIHEQHFEDSYLFKSIHKKASIIQGDVQTLTN